METRIEQLKKSVKRMGPNEIEFLEEYEVPMNEFFDNLKSKGFLKKELTLDEIDRLKKLATIANAPSQLFGNFLNIYLQDDTTIRAKEEQLKKIGFKINKEHFLTIACHNYQVNSEILKTHLVSLIYFNKMCLENADKKPLGSLINRLKKELPTNKFVMYLKTDIRNSVTHYTYYYENNLLHLCKGVFDPSPETMNLKEFMNENKRLNILSHALYLIYLDKYYPKGPLLLDKFHEK